MRQTMRPAAKQQKTKWRFRLAAAFLLPLLLVLLLDRQIRPTIENMTAYQAQLHAAKIVNAAMLAELDRVGVDYGELVELAYTSDGEIASIRSNMKIINQLKSRITEAVLLELEKSENQQLRIPLGTLIGVQLTAARGPDIVVKLTPSGYVQTNIKSQFLSAGINQTLHQITLEVDLQMTAIFPGYRVRSEMLTSYCIAETVIVGKVPEGFATLDMGAPASVNVAGSRGSSRQRAFGDLRGGLLGKRAKFADFRASRLVPHEPCRV